jgi:hypothetical protein
MPVSYYKFWLVCPSCCSCHSFTTYYGWSVLAAAAVTAVLLIVVDLSWMPQSYYKLWLVCPPVAAAAVTDSPQIVAGLYWMPQSYYKLWLVCPSCCRCHSFTTNCGWSGLNCGQSVPVAKPFPPRIISLPQINFVGFLPSRTTFLVFYSIIIYNMTKIN